MARFNPYTNPRREIPLFVPFIKKKKEREREILGLRHLK
jgi:hypothetical protein